MRSAPQAPSPPALTTAIDRAGALMPAIGARTIGIRRPNRSQNALARSRMLMARPDGLLRVLRLIGTYAAANRLSTKIQGRADVPEDCRNRFYLAVLWCHGHQCKFL